MSDWLNESASRRDGVTIPTLWVAIALSLLVHVAVLWQWVPRLHRPSLEEPERGETRGRLSVQLAPPTRPAPPPSAPPPPQTQRAPSLEARTAKPAPRARPAPPVVALNRPAPQAAPPAPPAPGVAAPARSPAEGDLASYVESRRRARAEAGPASAGESSADAPPVEDNNARANSIAAANLASRRPLTFGYDPAQGGGIFSIQRMGYDNAEFIFFGWNREIRRNTKQLIEVRRGNNSDIRIAVVRKMIAIIREYEQGDFVWESKRLDRNVSLSARGRDNAGLEDFMMREFFDDSRRAR